MRFGLDFFYFFRLVADKNSSRYFSIPQEKVADFEGVMMAFMGIFYAGMGAGQAAKSSNDTSIFSQQDRFDEGRVCVYIYIVYTLSLDY